jgi:PTH1 family peptidyl-tRNA hydrolase
MKTKAIIGLGNPGQKYFYTRHNIGFRVVDAIVYKYHETWSEKKEMMYASIRMDDGEVIHVIKPMTFMNSSGRVLPFLIKKGITPEEIVVVHDELEKPLGNVSLKIGGSARGHNGLRSIIETIGKDFWRLRFGIGRPEHKEMVSQYVLSRFSPEEEDQLGGLIEKSIEILQI